MADKKHFTQQVAKAMFDYTRKNPRNAKAELAESVWGFGFTKDSPRKIFSLSKMFLSCQHVTTGQNIYYGFTIEPGDGPLDFKVKIFEQKGDQKLKTIGYSEWSIVSIADIPHMIVNAAHSAKEQARALRLAHFSDTRK